MVKSLVRAAQLFVFGLAGFACASSANATSLTVSPQGSWIFGSNGNASVTITRYTPGAHSVGALAGAFAVKGNLDGVGGDENFNAWCVDITTNLSLPSTYSTNNSFTTRAITAAQKNDIQILFDKNYKSLDLSKASHSAGFQVALWEIIFETTGTYGLATGDLRVTTSNTAVKTFASALLAGLHNPAVPLLKHYKLTFLDSYRHRSQHLVTATPVPLPGALPLLATGLLGLGLFRRRTTKRG